MATKNDITGDALVSKMNNKAFEDNFDRIFRKKPALDEVQDEPEYSEDWQSEIRATAIAQNGNIGYGDDNEN